MGVSQLKEKYFIWASARENQILFSGFAKNKGTDQPARPGRLVSTFIIISILENIISRLATSEISIF